jgi:hypothetical protein
MIITTASSFQPRAIVRNRYDRCERLDHQEWNELVLDEGPAPLPGFEAVFAGLPELCFVVSSLLGSA